ncbi:MAG: universal stress protein [Syntrophobacteraceae bacterium]
MAYSKVLLALDMDDKGMALFEEALELAQRLKAELALLCCFEQETIAEAEERVATVSELDLSASQAIHDKQRISRLDHVRAWLESLSQAASKCGVTARADAEEGKTGQRICEMAEHWGADLIVLGHSTRHPIKEIFLGGINNYVLRHAPCAVLVTRRF